MPSSSIQYKLKSARDFDMLEFSGMFISVAELKRSIVERKFKSAGDSFGIVLSNAQSGEAYLNDAFLVPANTSVLVRRVPLAEMPASKASEPTPTDKSYASPLASPLPRAASISPAHLSFSSPRRACAQHRAPDSSLSVHKITPGALSLLGASKGWVAMCILRDKRAICRASACWFGRRALGIACDLQGAACKFEHLSTWAVVVERRPLRLRPARPSRLVPPSAASCPCRLPVPPTRDDCLL
ncbi:DWNN domain-containing protein [Pavlovales sp. CCMP2436]|nr:DWNN domain-containing protein [Pavlovales sp. CCMP2436]